jgi:hypothetical protein
MAITIHNKGGSGGSDALQKVDIINMALALIGSERVQLAAEDDAGTIGDQARLHYDAACQELTRMHAWNCCLERLTLGAGTGASESLAYPSDHAYPEKAQRVIYIGKATGETIRPKIDFAVEISSHTNLERVITHNFGSDVDAQIVAFPTNLAVLDHQFIRCLTVYLASKLAVPVAGNVNRQFELLKLLYEKLLPEARKSNTLEGVNEPAVDASYLETPMSPFTYKSNILV